MGIAPFSPVRRIVTGHDATGKAIVLMDGDTPYKATRPDSGSMQQRIWVTDKTPADMKGDRDRGGTEVRIAPPPGGSVIRVLDIPPESEAAAKLPNDHMANLLGSEHHAPDGVRPPRHPGMHRTRTVDYAIILAGEIDMLLDDSEVHLKAGDILVQQATNHAWVNRGKEPCRICFVLIDGAEPLA